MVHCIAIDDEPGALDVIRIHAAKMPDVKLMECFTNPFEALDYLKNNLIDLVFLDISMPGLSGIELISALKCPPRIVFTTAFSEYAVESYEFEAVDYLIKPINFERFNRSIQRYHKQLNNSLVNSLPPVPNQIFIKDGYKHVKLLVNEISHIQSDANYLSVFAGTQRVVARMTITQILEVLPVDLFIRVHNSYVVNILFIVKVENNHIFLKEARIPISEKYRESFYRRIGMENPGIN